MKRNKQDTDKDLKDKQHIPCRNYASDGREETGLPTIGFPNKTKNFFFMMLYSMVE